MGLNSHANRRDEMRMAPKSRPLAAMPSRIAREFCVQYPDGRFGDAELHEPILDNPEAESATRKIGKEAARRAVLTEAEIDKLYADD
jgi:hypothetical protein